MNTNDLIVGFDPTSATSITGAQLAQMVNSATPSSDRGFNLITTDSNGTPVIPDAVGTAEFQRYLWIRMSPQSSSFTVYAWNPNQTYVLAYTPTGGSPTSTNTYWNPISTGAIPAGSIQGYQIASATITKDKIVNIDQSQVNGLVGNYLTTGSTPAAGDITVGSSFAGGLVVGANAITSTKLSSDATVDANRAVGTNHIKNGAVTVGKFDTTGSINTHLVNTAANTPAWTPLPSIVQPSTPVVASAANVGKVPQVLTGSGTDSGTWQMVAPTSLGHILTIAGASSVTAQTGTKNIAITGTAPTTSNVDIVTAFGSSGAITFTPSSGLTSNIRVKVVLQLNTNASNDTVFGVLFNGTTPVAAAAANTYGNHNACVTFEYIFAPASASAITFRVGFAGVAGAAYLNSTGGTNTGVSAILCSSYTIEEYL